jgi:hypothetical protein
MLEDIVREALGSEAATFADGPPGPSPSNGTTLVIAAHGRSRDTGELMNLWRRRPDVAVLVIEPRDGHGVLYEVWPRRRVIGGLTGSRIRAAARAVVPWDERVPDRRDEVGI